MLFSGEIDTEGAEYARIAENIRLGTGYVGIATEGVQLFFPPLFPLLIAGVSMLGCDAEMAGRTVNVLFGALLVLPVYGIAKRMLGTVHGLGAAAIVAVHPFLVNFSTTVFCEPTYLTLILAAIFMVMIAPDRADWRTVAAAGFLYGLAYLIRPEAAIFMLVGIAFFFLQRALANRASLARTAAQDVRRAGFMLVCFGLVAAPYVFWLSLQTGDLTLQTKSVLNVATELRIQKGLPSYAASFAVGPELVAEGVWVQPNIDIIKGHRPSVMDYIKILPKQSVDVLRSAAATIGGSIEFGSPPLFALAVLGFFGRPLRLRTLIDQSHVPYPVVAFGACTVLCLFLGAAVLCAVSGRILHLGKCRVADRRAMGALDFLIRGTIRDAHCPLGRSAGTGSGDGPSSAICNQGYARCTRIAADKGAQHQNGHWVGSAQDRRYRDPLLVPCKG